MSIPNLAPVTLPTVYFAGRFTEGGNVPFHDHPGTELVFMTSGTCGVRVRDQLLEGTAGTLFVLPARIPHNQESNGQVRTTYANFTVPTRVFSETPRTVAVGLGSPVAGWLAQLADFERASAPPAVRGALALAVIESINQLEQREHHHRALHPGLVKAVRRIESEVLEELTVNDLGRAADLSPSHLTALFRERFGCGPIAYQQRQRLELACRLLRNSYLAVAEVAAASGYADANYFTRLFRQAYGCSPRTWRTREHQGVA